MEISCPSVRQLWVDRTGPEWTGRTGQAWMDKNERWGSLRTGCGPRGGGKDVGRRCLQTAIQSAQDGKTRWLSIYIHHSTPTSASHIQRRFDDSFRVGIRYSTKHFQLTSARQWRNGWMAHWKTCCNQPLGSILLLLYACRLVESGN